MKKIVVLFSIVVALTSCKVAKNISSLKHCEFKYHSITDITLAGVNLQNVTDLSSLNPLTASGLIAAFTSEKTQLPIRFTLNLNVKNPGKTEVLLNEFTYILEIDNVEMTTGAMDSRLQVAPGETSVLPLSLNFDLRKVMSDQPANVIKNLAFNFVGLSDQPANVTLKLKPSLTIGTQTINSPVYIPVSFMYGKNNK